MSKKFYSGDSKNDFCQRLGEDWLALANFLEIPSYRTRRFARGWEAHGVWEWLEDRNLLPGLPAVLVKIDRKDLADMLKEEKPHGDAFLVNSSEPGVEQESETRKPSRKNLMSPSVDFIIVTPLADERDAVLGQLGNHRRIPPSEQDIRVYYRADLPVTFPDDSTASYSVIVMPLLDMGRVQAATATADAIRR